MRIPKLTVKITRSDKTRNLSVRAVQRTADGEAWGTNILRRCHVRRIETAKARAKAQYLGVDEIVFLVEAEPDWKRRRRNAGNEQG